MMADAALIASVFITHLNPLSMASPPRGTLSRQLPLPSLRILVAIAEHGNFTRAATEVHLVPSAVSRRVQDLEAMVGLPLLHRTPHAVRFTEAGHLLLARARRILREVEGIEDDLASLSQGLRGRVRLATSLLTLFETLPMTLARFRRENPGVEVEFQSLSSKRIIGGLYDKSIDLGIFAAAGLPPEIEGALYREDHLTVLVPENHEFAGRSGLTLAEIADQNLICPPYGTEVERVLRTHAKRGGFKLQALLQVASLETMILMVQAELGLSILPSRVWARLAHFSNLVQVPLAEPWSLRQMYIGMLASGSDHSPTQRLYQELSKGEAPN
ncbi:MAG: LysR family transcriptional regulator [Pigmentiphaga sp.]